MRKCKKCGKDKDFKYFTLDDRSRAVYKDQFGKLWHGKTCYECFKAYIIKMADKKPLQHVTCLICQKSFKQRQVTQITCSQLCYKQLRIKRRLDNSFS